MEFFVTIMIFVAVMAVTVVIFGGWLVVTILRLVGRAVFGGTSPEPPVAMRGAVAGRICVRHKCRARNLAEAQFCRRCGQALPGAQRVSVRRAAVW